MWLSFGRHVSALDQVFLPHQISRLTHFQINWGFATDNHRAQSLYELRPPYFRALIAMNPEPCTCHPLHKGCDPQFCEAEPGKRDSSSRASAFKIPLEIIFSRAKLANAAVAGCITCGALQAGIVEDLKSMDWEEDIIVQRDHNHLDARLLHSTFEYFQGS